MRRIVPLKNSVLCKLLNEKTEINKQNGIFFKTEKVHLYQIVDFSVDKDRDFLFNVGDVVMSCSTGDELEVNPNETMYLFKDENIMCRVENP